MLEEQLRQQIIALVKREVIPAVGCTEPIAVALAVASSQSLLNGYPSRIHVALSPNMLKNAMGVGIPGTGMTGLPIAIALGAICGDSKANLEVLAKVTPDDVAKGKSLVDNNAISISLAPEGCDILYIEATVTDDSGHTATTVISGSHTNIVRQELDGKVLTLNDGGNGGAEVKSSASAPKLTMAQVWEFAMESPLDELKFILESRRINKLAAERSFTGRYGHEVGRTLHCERQRAMMGDSIFSRVLSYTSAACDARMAGAPIPVMSNSGSGNQGITCSVPLIEYAKELHSGKEKLYRALIISNLVAIHEKTGIGTLSAYCGAVSAGAGAGAGIVYLCGDGYQAAIHTVVNALAIVSGIVCDGAKASCAAKIASSVDAALLGYNMYKCNQEFKGGDGIVMKDIETTIKGIGRLGKDGMRQTNEEIIRLMIE